MGYVRFETVGLKNHPDLNKRWVQGRNGNIVLLIIIVLIFDIIFNTNCLAQNTPNLEDQHHNYYLSLYKKQVENGFSGKLLLSPTGEPVLIPKLDSSESRRVEASELHEYNKIVNKVNIPKQDLTMRPKYSGSTSKILRRAFIINTIILGFSVGELIFGMSELLQTSKPLSDVSGRKSMEESYARQLEGDTLDNDPLFP